MQGKLVVLEGIDGSGKSTQFRRLCHRLDAENMQFHRIIFPRYENPSSALIRMYLNGALGSSPNDVNAYAASTFYAVDRFASFRTDWISAYESGKLILSDRYTTANAVHQGAKVCAQELDTFLAWLSDFEYEKLELPRPDLVVYLDIDLTTARSRMEHRQKETDTTGDIHETDLGYLEKCIVTGAQAAKTYGWHCVSSTAQGRERTVEEIHEEIYTLVKELVV